MYINAHIPFHKYWGAGDLSGELGGNFAARDLTGRATWGAARFDGARDLGMAAAEKGLADGLQVRKWEVYRKREEERRVRL